MTKMLLCVVAGSQLLGEIGSALSGWDVHTAVGLRDAGQQLRLRGFKVGLLVLDSAGVDVHDIDAFLRQHCLTRWIAVCDRDALERGNCRQLLHDHCFDFHTWPLDETRLRHSLGHAHGVASLGAPPAARRIGADAMSLTGDAPCINRLRQSIRRVAGVGAPVLIWGESGTGKELVAHAVHRHSARADGPFVPINCAGLSPTLVQSELFGYERGAFTGATREKCGLIESAQGGSVFLDEIGDLPMEMQATMLRFLQEGTLYRVGGTQPRVVDVRIISASHVNLEQAVARGAFRQDLFFRLNVLMLEVPALRQRKEDLPQLAQHFFDRYAADRAPQLRGYSRAAAEAMQAHDWPGNVRELINRVRRALVMAEGRLIGPADLGLPAGGSATIAPRTEIAPLAASALALRRGGARVGDEGQAIVAALRGGKSVTQLAFELGVSRMTLYRQMAKFGIDAQAARSREK